MKKIGYLLYLICFALMALLPFLGMLVFGPAEAAANEILTDPPKLENKDGTFNQKILNDASDYLADRFWLRQELITVNARLEAGIFGESASKDVILGKNGWLYFTATLNDFQGNNPMTDRQIWNAAHNLALIQEYAEDRDAAFLFVMVPNKNSVYPEFMPESCQPAAEERNRDRLFHVLSNEKVDCLDLTDSLRSEKDKHQLYQSWDSHWNNLGAALAHDAIVSHFGKTDVLYRPEEFTARRDHPADLYVMLYPAGTELDEQLYPTWTQNFSYARPIRSPEDQVIRTTSETGDGSLMMFRDSFGNTLHTFMAESWAKACFSRAMPYQLSMLDAEEADTLILEITERNLVWLAQRPPVLPAPIRKLDYADAMTAPAAVIRAEERNRMYCVSGMLGESVDTQSPIWILANGTVYEASLGAPEKDDARCDDPGCFTAYLPESVSDLAVLYRSEGALKIAPTTFN